MESITATKNTSAPGLSSGDCQITLTFHPSKSVLVHAWCLEGATIKRRFFSFDECCGQNTEKQSMTGPHEGQQTPCDKTKDKSRALEKLLQTAANYSAILKLKDDTIITKTLGT